MNTLQNVTFKNSTWDIAATLRLPESFDPNQKYPAIVCAHPISSCKEQTAGNIYASALTKAGFITLTFDASCQGESGGEPRFAEDPATHVEDFRCAVDYLVTLPYVDEKRIGVLGVCGGGGYAVNAAMTERRYKAVATVVAANYGRLVREGYMNPDSVLKTLENIAKQRTAEARGAEPLIVSHIPNSPEECKQAGISNIDVVEAVDYYRTERGQHANSPNKLRLTSIAPAASWDAFHLAEVLLTQPLHIVIGGIPGGFGSYRDGFELYNRACSTNKTLQIVENTSHYQLYDQPEATGKALEQIIPFFKKHLD